MQTFAIVDNGKLREMTPEEIERLSQQDENRQPIGGPIAAHLLTD